MAGPLLPLFLVTAGAFGTKLAAWKYGRKALEKFQDEQAAGLLSRLESGRIRLFRDRDLETEIEARGAVYKITCDGQDSFDTRFGTTMGFSALDADGAKPVLICTMTRLNGKPLHRELSSDGRQTAAYWGVFNTVKELLREMKAAEAETPAEASIEGAEEAPGDAPDEPIVETPAETPAATDVAAPVKAASEPDTAPKSAPASEKAPATPAQVALLEKVAAEPGEVRSDVYPQSIGACFRKGWIESKNGKPGTLSSAPWWLTAEGEAALAASK